MMKKSKINFLFGLLITTMCVGIVNSQNDAEAKSVLDKASETMSSFDNLSMDFDYVLDNETEDVRQEMSGDLVLEGEKYKVNLFGSTQIFDGYKTYTIIPDNEEVNISDAEADQENTFKPSTFYSFYKQGYNYSMDELKTLKGRKIRFIKLIPIDSNSEVSMVLVGIDVESHLIQQVIEVGKNQTKTILTAKNIKTNQKLGSDVFAFDEKKYEEMDYIINK